MLDSAEYWAQLSVCLQLQLPGNGSDAAPFSAGANPYGTCATAGPGGSATIGSGLSCAAFTPLNVNASGLGLSGLQFNFKTPNTISSNLSVQYAVTHSMSATVAYVYTHAEHLQVGIGNNEVSQIIPVNTPLVRNMALPDTEGNHNYVPFPDFGQGGSYQATLGASVYNGLQTKIEQRLSHGFNYLVTYTYSKTMTDAFDLLNGGSLTGFRAPYVPGLGPTFDWGLASFDIRNVFHLSGGYELPVGRNKQFLSHAGKLTELAIGGWSANYPCYPPGWPAHYHSLPDSDNCRHQLQCLPRSWPGLQVGRRQRTGWERPSEPVLVWQRRGLPAALPT